MDRDEIEKMTHILRMFFSTDDSRGNVDACWLIAAAFSDYGSVVEWTDSDFSTHVGLYWQNILKTEEVSVEQFTLREAFDEADEQSTDD